MDIVVSAGSTLPNPAPGYVTIFINTENNNILSYKDASGNVHIYNGGTDDEGGHHHGLRQDYAYKLAKDVVKAYEEGLENGTLQPADMKTFINTGLNVKVKETDLGNGTRTYDINIGPRNMTESY